jgi:tRNA(Ile)-lysidine synthetase-like protein
LASPLKRPLLLQPGDSLPGTGARQAASPVPQIDAPRPLAAPDETIIGGGWRVEVSSGRADALLEDRGVGADPWVAFLDANALGSCLMLRPRQPGDRFQPQGLGGHRTKLNEFMINAKVPKDLRAGWPLLCGAAGIAWVCGLRVAEWAIVRPPTRIVWVVRFISPVESK